MADSPDKPVSLQHDAAHVYCGDIKETTNFPKQLKKNPGTKNQTPNPCRCWDTTRSQSFIKNMSFCMPLILLGTFMLCLHLCGTIAVNKGWVHYCWVATSMEVTKRPVCQGDLQVTGQDQEGGVCQLPNAEPRNNRDQRAPQAFLGFTRIVLF